MTIQNTKFHKIRRIKGAVSQYTMKGLYVETFNSISEAAEQTNIPSKLILGYIKNECNHGGGYLWGYDEDI